MENGCVGNASHAMQDNYLRALPSFQQSPGATALSYGVGVSGLIMDSYVA